MYTEEQIKEISKNKNVIKCSSKSITYKNKFKLWCVKKYYNEGCSPNEIFRESGLFKYLEKDTPKNCLKRWRKIFKEKGELGFTKEQRGLSRRSKNKEENVSNLKLDKDKYIKYLETKNAYLEELQKYFKEDLP